MRRCQYCDTVAVDEAAAACPACGTQLTEATKIGDVWAKKPDWFEEMPSTAFGQETPTALRSIIKGTEMLDNPGQSIFYSAPTTGGGFRTFLPFIAPSKGGKP